MGAMDAMDTWGADVLRLWTAAGEFQSDMRCGKTVLEAVGAVYKNLRYRLRMLLGLIDDLTPETIVAREKMEPLDRLALSKLDDVAHRIVKAYEEYRLHDVYLALVAYDGEDLSGFYIDVLKDPMYSGARDGARRRSAQSALFEILRSLCALLAPLLSFTAEEAWQAVPEVLRGNMLSVFDLELPRGSERGTHELLDLARWDLLKSLRSEVAGSEGMRDFQLEAHVRAPAAVEPALRALGDNLREALIVSAVELVSDPSLGLNERPRVTLSPAPGGKCARCWKTLPLGADSEHPQLCTPCAEIVRSL